VTATVDWTARTVSVTGSSLGVAFCEGDAPLLCVTDGAGAALGVIEHAEYDPVPDLEAFADDFAVTMRRDRTEHCNPAFELTQTETEPSTLFGADGVKYGWSGSLDGEVVERVIGHAAIVEDRLHIVTANLLGEGGCLARESELPLQVLEDAEPLLDAIVAGSTR